MAPKPLILPSFNCTDDYKIWVVASTNIVPHSNTAMQEIILPEFVHLNVTTEVSYNSPLNKQKSIEGYHTNIDFDVSNYNIFSEESCIDVAARIISLVEIPFPISKNLHWKGISFEGSCKRSQSIRPLENRADMIMEFDRFVYDLGSVYSDLDAKNVLTINLEIEKIITLPAGEFDSLESALNERKRTDAHFAEEFNELTRAGPMKQLERKIRALEEALGLLEAMEEEDC